MIRAVSEAMFASHCAGLSLTRPSLGRGHSQSRTCTRGVRRGLSQPCVLVSLIAFNRALELRRLSLHSAQVSVATGSGSLQGGVGKLLVEWPLVRRGAFGGMPASRQRDSGIHFIRVVVRAHPCQCRLGWRGMLWRRCQRLACGRGSC